MTEKLSHIVSPWSKDDGFCLGQKAIEEKSNEITAIPELIGKIQIRADYVLALKGNQGALYADVKEYFGDKEFLKQMQEKGCYKKTMEKAHSQIETREYYQTEAIGWLGQKKVWKGLKSIAMEKKTLEKAGKKKEESRHKLSMRKKRYVIGLRPIRHLEEVLNS